MDVFWIQKKYIIQLLKLSITIFGDQEQQSITIVANSQQLSGVGCWSGWICGQVQDGCLVLFLLAKLKNWSKGLHNAHREIHGSPSSCATRGCAVWRGSWSCPSTTAASAGPEQRLHFPGCFLTARPSQTNCRHTRLPCAGRSSCSCWTWAALWFCAVWAVRGHCNKAALWELVVQCPFQKFPFTSCADSWFVSCWVPCSLSFRM